MLLSMTGFGVSTLRTNDVSIATEIKTVNNRYLKIAIRTTDGYGFLEPRIEGLIRKHLTRGTVNLSMRVSRDCQDDGSRINEALLKAYFKQVRNLSETLGVAGPVAIDRFLGLPGVVQDDRCFSGEHRQTMENAALQSLQIAISDLREMRKNEGESMRGDLLGNLSQLREEVGEIERLAPLVVQHYRQRLAERIGKVMNENNLMLDKADLVREIAIFVDKSDISEEIVRFRCHLKQFGEVIDNDECCGRKLDFLTQEMFREANTMGSKSNDAQITSHVVEIKAKIERIREMVQNVE